MRKCDPTASWSGAPSRYAQSVPIRILKIALAAGKTVFIDRNPELVRDHLDVVDVEVDERVGAGVTLVFREIEADAPSCDR